MKTISEVGEALADAHGHASSESLAECSFAAQCTFQVAQAGQQHRFEPGVLVTKVQTETGDDALV